MRIETGRAQHFFQSVRDPARPILGAEHIAVVVAHPDDETIGCGALLRRLRGVRVIVVTDGAPRDRQDAHAYGFPTAEAYAGARKAELLAVMQLAGVARQQVIQLGIPDQQAARNLGAVTGELARLFSRHGIRIALTHAYEGGHPDHDATAFCVHEAASLGDRSIKLLEMPYYRAGDAGAVQQSFAPGGATPIVVALTEEERRLKRRMVSAYRTQARVLAGFSVDTEQFRIAPRYDFRRLPNGGRVLYERERWGITGQTWLDLVNAYLAREAAAA